MPNGGFEVLVMITFTWVCIHYTNIRSLLIVASNIIALVGSIVVYVLPLSNQAGLLIGYYMVSAMIRFDLLRYEANSVILASSPHGRLGTPSLWPLLDRIRQAIRRRLSRTHSSWLDSALQSKIHRSEEYRTIIDTSTF